MCELLDKLKEQVRNPIVGNRIVFPECACEYVKSECIKAVWDIIQEQVRINEEYKQKHGMNYKPIEVIEVN